MSNLNLTIDNATLKVIKEDYYTVNIEKNSPDGDRRLYSSFHFVNKADVLKVLNDPDVHFFEVRLTKYYA